MKKLLSQLLIIASVISKLVPVIIGVIEDFADDGKRNNSVGKPTK